MTVPDRLRPPRRARRRGGPGVDLLGGSPHHGDQRAGHGRPGSVRGRRRGPYLLDFVSEEDGGRLSNALTQADGNRARATSPSRSALLAPGREPWLTEVRIAALGHRRTDGYLITAAASAGGHPGLNSLRRIAEDPATGARAASSFPFLARHAAESLGVRHVLIGRFEGSPPARISTVAVWSDGKAVPNFSYDLAGTPCSDALQRRICHFAEGVRDRYPENMLLRELGVESYIGASILDADHQPVGVLAVLDDRPRYRQEDLFSAVYLLSVRAGAELERERIAAEMRESGGTLARAGAGHLRRPVRHRLRHGGDVPVAPLPAAPRTRAAGAACSPACPTCSSACIRTTAASSTRS